MPLYEYRCQNCDSHTEVMQRFADPPLATCEECGGELKKLISAPAFHLKGEGWYVTDYARKGDKDQGKKAKEGGDKEGGAKEAKDAGGGKAKNDGGKKTASETGGTKPARAASKS